MEKFATNFPGEGVATTNGAGNYADQSARRRGASVIENYSDNFRETSPVGSFKPNAPGTLRSGWERLGMVRRGYKGSSSGTGRDWGVLRGGSLVNQQIAPSYNLLSERGRSQRSRCHLMDSAASWPNEDKVDNR